MSDGQRNTALQEAEHCDSLRAPKRKACVHVLQVAQGGDSKPAVWAVAHPEAPQRSLNVTAKKLQLPLQDNFCDCGLFLLTYAEFFTHSLPDHIRTKSRQRLDPAELEGVWTAASTDATQL